MEIQTYRLHRSRLIDIQSALNCILVADDQKKSDTHVMSLEAVIEGKIYSTQPRTIQASELKEAVTKCKADIIATYTELNCAKNN